MDEIAGDCVGPKLAAIAPADFAGAAKNECNGILAAMMVNPGPRARLHFEQSTPDRRADTKLRRDRGAAFGSRRLCRSGVKAIRADDVDCVDPAHAEPFVVCSCCSIFKWALAAQRLNCRLERSRRIERSPVTAIHRPPAQIRTMQRHDPAVP